MSAGFSNIHEVSFHSSAEAHCLYYLIKSVGRYINNWVCEALFLVQSALKNVCIYVPEGVCVCVRCIKLNWLYLIYPASRRTNQRDNGEEKKRETNGVFSFMIWSIRGPTCLLSMWGSAYNPVITKTQSPLIISINKVLIKLLPERKRTREREILSGHLLFLTRCRFHSNTSFLGTCMMDVVNGRSLQCRRCVIIVMYEEKISRCCFIAVLIQERY